MRAVAIVPVRRGQFLPGGPEAIAETVDVLTGRPAGDLGVVVVGPGASGLAAAVGSALPAVAGDQLAGVSVASLDVDDLQPRSVAASIAPWVLDAEVVIVGGSADGRDIAVHLSMELAHPLVAGALDIRPPVVTVWSHGGRLQRDVEVTGSFVATIEPGVRSVPRWLSEVVHQNHGSGDDTSTPTVEIAELEMAPVVSADAVLVLGEDDADPSTVDLSEADRLVGVGAGLMRPDAERSLAAVDAVASSIGASVGATRVVTDAGLFHHDRQIGTTGVVVDPDLYLAFAISGAVQHTAGLGDPDHIIAVNLDPHCPMMAMADLAVTSDANEVVVELARLMTEEVSP